MVKELEKGMAMFAHDECTVNYKIMSLTIKTHKSSSEIQCIISHGREDLERQEKH